MILLGNVIKIARKVVHHGRRNTLKLFEAAGSQHGNGGSEIGDGEILWFSVPKHR